MFRWTALVAAVVLIVAMVGVILSSQKSIEPSYQPTAEKNQKGNDTKKDEITLFDRWFPDSTAVFSLFLMIFTGVLAFGGLHQLNLLTRAERIATETAQAAKDSADATKKAVELSDKTAERQLRAYVGVFSSAVEEQTSSEGKLAIAARVEIRNAGQTPAYNLRSWIAIEATEPPTIPFHFPPNLEERPTGMLPPGTNTNLDISFATTAEVIQSLHDNRRSLYVWGRVEYRDAFGHDRYLVFHLVARGFLPSSKRWHLGPYPPGENAD
jgi:hypothetical protein